MTPPEEDELNPVRLEGRLTRLEQRVDHLEVRRQERRAAMKELEAELEEDLDSLQRTATWTRRGVVLLLAAHGGDVGVRALTGEGVQQLAMMGLSALGLA